MTDLICFDGVTVRVRDKILLDSLSFSIGQGDKVVFTGRSGSGKSTVLKTLLGLYPQATGSIYYLGHPIDGPVLRSIRSAAAYIGQEPLLGADTVREALLLPFGFKAHRGQVPGETRMVDILCALDLPATILDQSCNRVSGGEKQRIALARALLMGKSLYLMDEVTSALDPKSKQAVFNLLEDASLTVLSVAHDPDWIKHCHVIYELEQGRLVREQRHGHA